MAVLKITIGKPGKTIADHYAYLTKKSKTKTDLVSSINCRADQVVQDMQQTKALYGKTEGRQYYDIIQTFDIGENITPERAHELGEELARKMYGSAYECSVVTHVDKGYIHNHILVNSVSFVTGKKNRNRREDLLKLKNINEKILKREGLLTIKELKKQKRGSSNRTSADVNMSARFQTDKDYITCAINKNLIRSGSMPEFVRRMRDANIEIKFTEKGLYYNYKYVSYTHNALGSDYNEDQLLKRFAKKKSHIERIREAVSQAREDSDCFEDFINKLSETKGLTINARGKNTISIQYYKRKPVRIDVVGGSVSELRTYFEQKNDYNLIRDEVYKIINESNINLDQIEIINLLKESNIVSEDINAPNDYVILNNKKLSINYLLEDIKFKAANQKNKDDNNFIKELHGYFHRCESLENLHDFGVKYLKIGDDYVFIKDEEYCMSSRDAVDKVFEENKIRVIIYDALNTATNIEMFKILAGVKVEDEEGTLHFKLNKSNKILDYYGSKNSYGNNNFSYNEILKKLSDNDYYRNKQSNFRAGVRKNIWQLIKTSDNASDFYFQINNIYKTKMVEDALYIYDPEINDYYDIKSIVGQNSLKNRLRPENIEKAIREYKNLPSQAQKNMEAYSNTKACAFIGHLWKCLFKASTKKQADRIAFDEKYYKKQRLSEERKSKRQGYNSIT